MTWLPGGNAFVMLLYGNGLLENNGYRVDLSGAATPLISEVVLATLGTVTSFRVTPDGKTAFIAATCGDYGDGSVAYRENLATGAVTRLSPDATRVALNRWINEIWFHTRTRGGQKWDVIVLDQLDDFATLETFHATMEERAGGAVA